jgi:hypothetical protein
MKIFLHLISTMKHFYYTYSWFYRITKLNFSKGLRLVKYYTTVLIIEGFVHVTKQRSTCLDLISKSFSSLILSLRSRQIYLKSAVIFLTPLLKNWFSKYLSLPSFNYYYLLFFEWLNFDISLKLNSTFFLYPLIFFKFWP